MSSWAFKPCPWCESTDVAVESEQIVDRIVTGVDEDNGPVYWAECQHCGVRGPLVGWAADAIPKWNDRAALTPSAGDRGGVVVTEEMVERALTSGPIPNYCNFGHLLKRAGIANGQDWMRAALEAAIGGGDGVAFRPERWWLLNVIEDLEMRDGQCSGIDYLDAILVALNRGPCNHCRGSGCISFEGDAGTCTYCDGSCIQPPSPTAAKDGGNSNGGN